MVLVLVVLLVVVLVLVVVQVVLIVVMLVLVVVILVLLVVLLVQEPLLRVTGLEPCCSKSWIGVASMLGMWTVNLTLVIQDP